MVQFPLNNTYISQSQKILYWLEYISDIFNGYSDDVFYITEDFEKNPKIYPF